MSNDGRSIGEHLRDTEAGVVRQRRRQQRNPPACDSARSANPHHESRAVEQEKGSSGSRRAATAIGDRPCVMTHAPIGDDTS